MNDALQAVNLSDYQVPDYSVDRVELAFDLREENTIVRSELAMRRNNPGPLVLNGEDLTLLSVSVDGNELAPASYKVSSNALTIWETPSQFVLRVEVCIQPQNNTKLEGLYKSSGNFCTQCEAEGFRRVTYYLDRPDVMAVFTVRIEADKDKYPVLLSNGNMVDEGKGDENRHWVKWYDPYPKPSYLFALVAGDLAVAEDRYETSSGRDVALRIYVEHGKENSCAHAMASLKKAMRWDEERFGLEYDLDIYMIVAVSDFNMGAMENKGLNVFNDKYVLADPETATDSDYGFIEAIVAHEYFHNWTGNRVTLRDWFQLSLKEGLTVFRDQEFSADVRSGAVKRIQDVRTLRARQFPEDAGPLAHPVRPASYIEINNFYTATVYEKGAELVRMMQTIVGKEAFEKGVRRYLSDNDGLAATVEDFVSAIEVESGTDLTHFMEWYRQAGTPSVSIEKHYDEASRLCQLTFRQANAPTPGQDKKGPLHIPIRLGLLDETGAEIPLCFDGENPADAPLQRTINLLAPTEIIEFVCVKSNPVVSALRDFSAPVTLSASLSDSDRAFLLAHDKDPFNRWEAGQQYATDYLLKSIAASQKGEPRPSSAEFVFALGGMLSDASLGNSFKAEAMLLPSEEYLGNQMKKVDVAAIHQACKSLRQDIAQSLSDNLLRLYHENKFNRPYRPNSMDAAQRKLKNGALSYLVTLDDPSSRALCVEQFEKADNMTDSIAALGCLIHIECPEREIALSEFYERWQNDSLVLDKWLSLQAMSSLTGTLSNVKKLLEHPVFSIRNPNKVRALIGGFCAGNQFRFHSEDGAGYAFLANQVMILDEINPQVAARLLAPLGQWRRFDDQRQSAMRAQLCQILGKQDLSPDVYEIASKALD